MLRESQPSKSQRPHAIRRTVTGLFLLALVWTIALGAQVKPTTTTTTTAKKTVLKVIDINSASETEITGLGIDSSSAKKIIAGRPFHNKKDLLSRQLLTTDQYNKVKDLIVARQKKG